MTFLRSLFLRTLLALALPAALVAQLLAIPAPLQAKSAGWMEICTVEGMVKLQIGPNGEPVEQAPSQGHEFCDLCLPAHVATPPDAPAVASARTRYETVKEILKTEAPTRPVQTGPPIGARGPPIRS
jgi:hypothetical protein